MNKTRLFNVLKQAIFEELRQEAKFEGEEWKYNEKYVDSSEIKGDRVWVHTNRTHAKNKKQGLVGIYRAKKGKKTGNVLHHTNSIFLRDCQFNSKEEQALRILADSFMQGSMVRDVIAGISGEVIEEIEGSLKEVEASLKNEGYESAAYLPHLGYFSLTSILGRGGYFAKNLQKLRDNPPPKLISADYVYLSGKEEYDEKLNAWVCLVKNPKYESVESHPINGLMGELRKRWDKVRKNAKPIPESTKLENLSKSIEYFNNDDVIREFYEEKVAELEAQSENEIDNLD